MHEEEANKHSKARNDDQQIEKDDNFDQQGHAGNENLRAKEYAVFQNEQSENLADRLVAHGQHQKSEEFHRKHDGQSENHNMSGWRRLPVHVIRDDEGEHHHELRTQKGWTQAYLAEISGLGRLHISELENGRREAGLRALEMLATSFDLTVAELLKGV